MVHRPGRWVVFASLGSGLLSFWFWLLLFGSGETTFFLLAPLCGVLAIGLRVAGLLTRREPTPGRKAAGWGGIVTCLLSVVFLGVMAYGLHLNSTEGPCNVYDDPDGTGSSMDWLWSRFAWECTKTYPSGTVERFYVIW